MMEIAEIANGYTDANRFSFQFRNIFDKRVGLFQITVVFADMVAFAARVSSGRIVPAGLIRYGESADVSVRSAKKAKLMPRRLALKAAVISLMFILKTLV